MGSGICVSFSGNRLVACSFLHMTLVADALPARHPRARSLSVMWEFEGRIQTTSQNVG
jgi:hypothetical protein